jgi:hypothetical protein
MTFARALVVGAVVIAAGSTAFAQRFGNWANSSMPNVPYDGKFVFIRMAYPSGFGRGGPRWAHDYPLGESHFLNIFTTVTNVQAHVEASSVMNFDDHEMFKFPVIYLVEPGDWTMSDVQVKQLHDYLAKGGFLIVDDFPYWAWARFDENMSRVFPQGRWIDLDVTHPIFHSFFDIETLDIVPAYPQLGERPIFRAMFQDNDPSKRMYVIANYQNDLSEFWEFSDNGFYAIDRSNEAYKVGVNQFVYGLTH